MKRILYTVILLLPLWAAAQGNIRELDRIVAVVNDDVIMKSELEHAARSVLADLQQKGTRPPPQAVLLQQVLDKLVMEHLQLQEAEKLGVTVEDELVNRAVESVASRNGLTVAQFREVLERDGFDFAGFREELKERLTMEQVARRQVDRRIRVTDRELRDYLSLQEETAGGREYKLGHILVSVSEAPTPEELATARDIAAGLAERARAGEDFRELAVAHSDGQNALEGGEMEWRERDRLPSLVSDVMADMGPSDVTDVLRSPSGFHIFKVLDVRDGERTMITQTQARHILLRPDELTAGDDVRIRLQQLKDRIEGGDDFAELARSHSQDRGSAVNGGDLGWVNPGDTVPQFERVMNDLAPGEISEPFESPFGWHIVQVLERRDHDSTEEVRKAKAREELRNRKRGEEMETWLRRLRDEAYVENRLFDE